ncbi:MAG TPA: hypothetical protein H9867_09520 [Candidatus Corynebacterium gallistercoris]|uniref:SGNH hydrolase-type esterase domain-containing protein n=1 Tax=Candidatus Corynebacterium gallistercoris TaxID=2838530 RepID=A0A9D1RY63_9CORY|nr:hypothetical protein [Candidatus Corynebacterium gallistercoris]
MLKKLARTLVAAAATTAAVVTMAPAAQAAPGNSVVLGDSLAANPTIVDYVAGKFSMAIPGARVNPLGCGTDYRLSGSIGAANGTEVADYTCAGASYRTGGIHMIDQVRRAHRDGALDAGTREVVLFSGANDTYPYMINDRMPVPQIREQLKVAIRDAVNEARRLAPNAKIKVVGYPTISNPDGRVCLLNVIPGQPTVDVLFNIREVEDALQWAAVDAAAETGAQFVDLKPLSAGHGMCSNDRWIAGVIDTTSGPRNLILHMTDAGLNAVGEHIGRA